MNGFSKCPQCGSLEERRMTCECGYVAGQEFPKVAMPEPIEPEPPVTWIWWVLGGVVGVMIICFVVFQLTRGG